MTSVDTPPAGPPGASAPRSRPRGVAVVAWTLAGASLGWALAGSGLTGGQQVVLVFLPLLIGAFTAWNLGVTRDLGFVLCGLASAPLLLAWGRRPGAEAICSSPDATLCHGVVTTPGPWLAGAAVLVLAGLAVALVRRR